MRNRFFIFVMLLLAVCGVALKGDVWEHVDHVVQRLREAPILGDAEISQTYLLPANVWLRFRLPQRGNLLRILTTASVRHPIPEIDSTSIRPGWRYCLEYRVVDSAGKVLREAPFHFRTHITEYEQPESHRRITSSFFEDRQRVPTITRRLLVPLEQLDGKHFELHLRLVDKDGALDDVAVRLACHAQRHHYDRPDLWQKISTERKERICSASIYPPELMSLEQRRAVLRRQWKPLAPSGVEGRDYVRREMYTHAEIEGYEADLDYLPPGMIVHASRHAVLPLPETLGVRLSVERLAHVHVAPSMESVTRGGTRHLRLNSASANAAPTQASKQAVRLVARWFGQSIRQRREHAWELTDDRQTFDVPFTGGMLEIESTHPVALTASWQREGDGDVIDITPEATLVRVYPCRPEAPLHFRVAHSNNAATPLRVAFRYLSPATDTPISSRTHDAENRPTTIDIRWQYVDQEGQVIDGGSVPAAINSSLYDHLDNGDEATTVSDPTHYHWCVPPHVATIRFESADERVHVSASTRPAEMSTTTFVPSLFETDESEAVIDRNWFPLRPEEHARLVKYLDSKILHLQQRPPEDDPQILAGQYHWEDFQPLGSWRGRNLVEPRVSDAAVREEALESTFLALPTCEDVPIDVLSEQSESTDLSLVFVVEGDRGPELVSPSSVSSPLSVFLDGQQRGTHPLGTGPGELRVGDVSPGRHVLRIEAPEAVRVLVNCIDAQGRAQFIKRFAVLFDETSLEFDVEKISPDRELLVLDYYFDLDEAASPIELEATIVSRDPERGSVQSADGPMLSWTSTSRVFHVQPPTLGEAKGFLLATANESVSQARRCFIPLGENLPAGRYRLRIKSLSQQRAYLVLSRTTPGPYELRKMTRQPLAAAGIPDY